MPTFTSSTLGKYTGAWLIGVGIFELALAAVFFFVGGSAMVLTGVILGVVGVILVLFGIGSRRKAKENQRIDDTGLAGTGQIVGMSQTGLYLNENPQIGLNLNVTVPGRNPYQVEVRQFVPLMLLARIQMGATLPVKVDQQDPSKVVIDWDAPGPQAGAFPGAWGTQIPGGWGTQTAGAYPGMQGTMPGAYPGMAGAAMPGAGMPMVAAGVNVDGQNVDQMRAQMAAAGLDGTATIQMAQDTGVAIGNNRLFSVQMTVNVPGRTPYQETSAAMVPVEDAPKIVAGVTVPVKVSPDNPNLVMIQWDKV